MHLVLFAVVLWQAALGLASLAFDNNATPSAATDLPPQPTAPPGANEAIHTEHRRWTTTDSEIAGAIMSSTSLNGVMATVTVPALSWGVESPTPDLDYEIANMGTKIDGVDCATSCGVGIYMFYSDGDFRYRTFYQCTPGEPVFTDIPIETGDVVVLSVLATSDTSANFGIQVQPNAKQVFTLENQPPLCQRTACWIMENLMPDGGIMPGVGLTGFSGCSYNIDGVSNSNLTEADIATTDTDDNGAGIACMMGDDPSLVECYWGQAGTTEW